VHEPLVSIGLPTFSRPEGLFNALNSLLAQTWTNIEIIVSDNASLDYKVQEVTSYFASLDRRIKVFRQNTNIGSFENFLFVLDIAKGDFFMWAADDDDWEPDFISESIKVMGLAGLAMTNFSVVNPLGTTLSQVRMPELDPNASLKNNITAFFSNMQPSLVYGLYKTTILRECVPRDFFDFWDCVLVFRVLVRYGIKTSPKLLYRAGVPNNGRQIKLAKPSGGRLLYRHWIHNFGIEIFMSKKLCLKSKIILIYQLLKLVHTTRRHLNPIVNDQVLKGL
jgi:glycosyltransferase involved in cell wall biosynthesis